jgi:hypothetical protein
VSKINISIDDISPHPKSSIKVLDRCYEIIEEFPDAKFSLFVPIAYWRTVSSPPESVSNLPYALNQYPEFCKSLKDLSICNFEVCYHGFYHGILDVSNNDEFKSLSFKDAMIKFELMKTMTKLAGLDTTFKNIFRPPAWRMSPESFDAAKASGIEILALSDKDYVTEGYGNKHIEFKNVVYYNVNPPFDELEMHEKIEAVYHACEWDKNYLDHNKTCDIISFLRKNKHNLEFCFMNEMIDG